MPLTGDLPDAKPGLVGQIDIRAECGDGRAIGGYRDRPADCPQRLRGAVGGKEMVQITAAVSDRPHCREVHGFDSYRLRSIRRAGAGRNVSEIDRKSTRLNSSHLGISYAVFCLKKKNTM